jgi:integrase
LRHSFASYHLAHFQDAAKLALELGHTKQELLFQHYQELVTPEVAAKYWDIRPVTQTSLIALSA